MGIKNPLVNPVTADSMGERRMAFCGNVRMSQMSRAIHVWFLTSVQSGNTPPNSCLTYNSIEILCVV